MLHESAGPGKQTSLHEENATPPAAIRKVSDVRCPVQRDFSGYTSAVPCRPKTTPRRPRVFILGEGYSKVTSEYIDALVARHKALSVPQAGLPEIAADIRERASFLSFAGQEFEATYFKYGLPLAAFPVAHYMWMDVYNAGNMLQRVGDRVGAFASEIHELFRSYETMQKQLEDELEKVSTELGRRAA